ncbi:MAG TPA: alpha/beta hydrolase-fold protein [Gaiellaceae bacterium]|nr:alpha/beta hydrolase-fold protein [Gaiellaceae bacterium]
MTWHRRTVESAALRGNPLGDPAERPLWIWSPDATSQRHPVVYVLHAHMRSAASWFNVEPFQRAYPEEIDALHPPAIVVLVDGWTSVGGSQWIDSDGIGRYATYLAEDVVPLVEAEFPANGLRGLQGKSSGGYGAVVNALRRPDLFHACAAHAPDALFDVTLARGFAPVARALRERFGTLEDFWRQFTGLRSHDDALLVELAACARAFGDGALPADAETGAAFPEAFAGWLEHDPVRLVAVHADAARSLRGVWLDAGRSDSYYLDLGALALRRAFERAGVDVRFELFDGGHGGMSWRYPLSLQWLVGVLGKSA